MATDDDIASWIRRQLKRRNWKPADLARSTGVGTGRVSDWVTGKSRPSPESCQRLADAFNVDADDVLALAGHRIPARPVTSDDPRTGIFSLLKRVELTEDRRNGLEALLATWIASDKAAKEARDAASQGR